MSGQYQNLVNKQYNSPIGLYSDQSVREILESQTQVLSNGAIGIDFNNPMMSKPTNLQNSAVLRMLEEEENRKRSGQPGSLKRVAWPPPPEETDEFVEQPAVQAQGGPVNPSKSAPGSQVYHIPIQQPIQEPDLPKPTPPQPKSQVYHIPIQQSTPEPTTNKPSPPQPKPEEIKVFTSSTTFQPIPPASPQPPSPSLSRSPVEFTSLAKPWSPQQSPTSSQYRSVHAPSMSSTSQSYKSSKITEYSTSQQYQYSSQTQSETKPVLQIYSTSSKESTFEQHPTISSSSSSFTQSTVTQTGREIPVFRPAPPPEFKQQTLKQENQSTSKLAEKILTVKLERADPEEEVDQKTNKQVRSPVPQQFSAPPPAQTFVAQQPPATQTYQQPTKQVQFESQTFIPQPQTQPVAPKVASAPPRQVTSDPLAPSQQGVPQPQRTFTKPKPVEPPPSTITLRPQAPVSQAPPPLVSSQPATAKFRGGKNLRGDLKWPPEEVKEKMAAEKQHLLDLAKGPACRPKKQHKDYTPFFAKHQLNNTYPGYKIPPGTQFYEHNPVM